MEADDSVTGTEGVQGRSKKESSPAVRCSHSFLPKCVGCAFPNARRLFPSDRKTLDGGLPDR